MDNLIHLQTNIQPPQTTVDEHGIETLEVVTLKYKTTDGKKHDSKDDAIDHQKIVDFVEDTNLVGMGGTTERGCGYEYVPANKIRIKQLLISRISQFVNS